MVVAVDVRAGPFGEGMVGFSAAVKRGQEEDSQGELLQTLKLSGKAAGKKKVLPDSYRDRF